MMVNANQNGPCRQSLCTTSTSLGVLSLLLLSATPSLAAQPLSASSIHHTPSFPFLVPSVSPASPTSLPPTEIHLAQWFYPEGDRSIIQVIGIGQVNQSADRAILSLPFAPAYETELPPDGVLSQFGWEEPDPLTLEELEPIVDALVASGLDASTVEPTIVPSQAGAFPFPFPSGSSIGGALVIVTLDDPQTATLDQAVETAQEVVEESDRLNFGSPQVTLELDNCVQLEQKAYQAAVTSAQVRADAIATALNVDLAIPAISEPFYSPLLSGCYGDSLSVFGEEDEPYIPGMELSVEFIKQLFFSYPIESE